MKTKKAIAGILAAVTLLSSVAASSYAVEPKFNDVSSNAWYASAVNVVVGHNMMAGSGNNTFAPNTTMNRAMLVQVLYNHAGKPTVNGSSAFADVETGAWYCDAVQWAAKNGIAAGVGNNRFNPNGAITREQFATILFNYYKTNHTSPALEHQVLENFNDVASISSWAQDGMAWAVDMSIINGTDKNTLRPTAAATRAEAAQMLSNMIEYVTEDHKYTLTNTVPATDKADGKKEYTCSICNNVKTEVLPATGEPADDQPSSDYATEVARLVNVERAKAGLKPLTVDTQVQAVAQLRAKEIKQAFSHTRPNGTACFTALDEQDVSYVTAGENIAYGYPTPADVMEGWMNSPGHRANILDSDYTKIGVGYVVIDGTPYWTQMFIA